ncbi:MAG TPA: hypothetical protein PLW35_08085, partial [Verrucomicrobiota bacterium]|nr:hypothetical protein [Verrucomicrobiota bacterium]
LGCPNKGIVISRRVIVFLGHYGRLLNVDRVVLEQLRASRPEASRTSKALHTSNPEIPLPDQTKTPKASFW